MSKWQRAVAAITVVVLVGLAGCATKSEPFEYRSDNDHMRGGGLFSGEDGYFSISRQPPSSDEKTVVDADDGEEPAKQETYP